MVNPATMTLKNGTVLTLDSQDTVAEAVALSGDRILAVGRSADIEAMSDGAQPIDLKGRTVIPGLIDGHAHMDREGLKDRLPSLAGARKVDDILQIVRGGNWNAARLGRVVPDTKAFWHLLGSILPHTFPCTLQRQLRDRLGNRPDTTAVLNARDELDGVGPLIRHPARIPYQFIRGSP